MAEDNSNRHVFPNLEIREKLEKMLNNEKFSDTVFHVNNSQFHASSHLVSVSSNVLESMLDDHYNNCGDRDIKIGNVKQGASFSIILRYLYGLEIDFEDMTRDVLCEVLGLAERFDLNNFYKELKTYISMLDCFQVDSTVVLLNTAKKYDIEDLYEKVKTFAFDNTDALVKDESFVELQYDVLRDLVKSDWFCTSEIDILRGVLMWHSENLKKEANNEATLFVNEKKDDESQTGEDEDLKENPDVKTCDNTQAEDNSEDPDITANENCTQLVKTFSENVLKTLLSHIRLEQISLGDYISLFKTELFMNYDLLDRKQFSQVYEPRKKRVANGDVCEAVNKITVHENIDEECYFDTYCRGLGKRYKSDDEPELHGMKFQIHLIDNICKESPFSPFRSKIRKESVNVVDVFLQCTAGIFHYWKCIVQSRIEILDQDFLSYGSFIPEDNDNVVCTIELTASKKRVKVGQFYYPSSQHDYKTGPQFFEIKMIFKSITIEEQPKLVFFL